MTDKKLSRSVANLKTGRARMNNPRYEQTEEEDYLPRDWENPDWSDNNWHFCWRAVPSAGIRGLWETFSHEQKKALARHFDYEANRFDLL